MAQVPLEWQSWADLLAKGGQSVFGLCTLGLTLWAATFKRKELFRTALVKKQIEELAKVRTDLQSIFFDLHYIPLTAQTMKIMGWNLDDLKKNDPESWEQYKRYKDTSLDLLYKFSDSDYYLFPDWITRRRRLEFAESMRAFVPFTIYATASKSEENRNNYAIAITQMKTYFDVSLQTHA